MDLKEGSATGAFSAGPARRKVSKRQMAQWDAVELECFAGWVKIASQSKSLQPRLRGRLFSVLLALRIAAREVTGHSAREISEFLEFLHHIREAIVIRRRTHPSPLL